MKMRMTGTKDEYDITQETYVQMKVTPMTAPANLKEDLFANQPQTTNSAINDSMNDRDFDSSLFDKSKKTNQQKPAGTVLEQVPEKTEAVVEKFEAPVLGAKKSLGKRLGIKINVMKVEKPD